MAESGAHVSSAAASTDSTRPSIFEVLAQESLLSALKPALRHVLRIATERNPVRYGRLYVYCDELYAALQLILESYYLKRYNATFSENFYGLRRVPLRTKSDGGQRQLAMLSVVDRIRSLIVLIGAPYIKHKLDQLYERLSELNATGTGNWQGLKGQLCKAFLAVYPFIHAVWEGTVLYFQLFYIFGQMNCHSPLLRIAGLKLCNLSEEEQLNIQTSPTPLSVRLANKSLLQQLFILLGKSLTLASVALSSGLSVGVFFLQFLDWWYTSDRRVLDVTSLPNPGPPPKYAVDSRYRNACICPLCNKLRTNDTALSVSGFVFCYPCIMNYVKEKGSCPITGYPTRIDHLVRLYQADDFS